MNDFLVELGANPIARQAIKKIGLPIPLPQKLKRARGAWSERPISPVTVRNGRLFCPVSATASAAQR